MKITKVHKTKSDRRAIGRFEIGPTTTCLGDNCQSLVHRMIGVRDDQARDVLMVMTPAEARTLAAALIHGAARCDDDRSNWLLEHTGGVGVAS